MKIDNIQVTTEPISKSLLTTDVILTFQSSSNYAFNQEFCKLNVPVNVSDKNVVQFVHKKILVDISEICIFFNRNPGDLLKISISSNWDVYKRITGCRSLPEFGHSCKWHFGNGRNDLDEWEKILMQKHGFGSACDMTWINDAFACAGQSNLMGGL